MDDNDISILEKSIDKAVRLRCTDGELILAKIDCVDRGDGEIVYELLSTTDETKYEKSDRQPAYLIRFTDVDSVERVP